MNFPRLYQTTRNGLLMLALTTAPGCVGALMSANAPYQSDPQRAASLDALGDGLGAIEQAHYGRNQIIINNNSGRPKSMAEMATEGIYIPPAPSHKKSMAEKATENVNRR